MEGNSCRSLWIQTWAQGSTTWNLGQVTSPPFESPGYLHLYHQRIAPWMGGCELEHSLAQILALAGSAGPSTLLTKHMKPVVCQVLCWVLIKLKWRTQSVPSCKPATAGCSLWSWERVLCSAVVGEGWESSLGESSVWKPLMLGTHKICFFVLPALSIWVTVTVQVSLNHLTFVGLEVGLHLLKAFGNFR